MDTRKKTLTTIGLLTGVLLIGLIVLNGCKKTEPSETAKTETVAAEAIVQTMCPMEGTPIDKNFYTEYKGKKVYFCCADCIAKFEKEPEKYVGKLPQFKN